MSHAPEYLARDGLSAEALADALAPHFEDVRDGRARRTARTYYDTFDGLLHRAGVTLAHEDGTLVLTDRATGARRASAVTAPVNFVSELAAGPLREAIAPVIDVRALLPVAAVRTLEHPLDLLDDEGKTVVRIALDEPALVKPARPLRARVRVAGLRGYDRELDRACAALEADAMLASADEPLVDEAVRAAGGVVGGFPSKLDVKLTRDQRADGAAAMVLRPLLNVIEANYQGTIGDVDSEFLHDLRVAVRRTRAVQRELRDIFPARELAHFRSEFRWLQQVTGDARDLDVYVLEFERFRELVPEEMRADLGPVLDVLAERRRAARSAMVRALLSARALRLRREWSSFLDSLERPAPPIAALAGKRIRKVYRRMVQMGKAIDESSPAEDYHELRKKGKELRYLLELFGTSLYPREVVAPMVKGLKALQDVLGRHQDREVQVAMLRSLRDEVAARSGGPEALMAMGALVARLEEDERAARAAFAERFAEFAAKKQRGRVKDTFA